MKIQPVTDYKRLIPTAVAFLSSVVTGCDSQTVVGSVPNPNPPQNENKQPATPSPAEQPEELPQILGGDVPAEIQNID